MKDDLPVMTEKTKFISIARGDIVDFNKAMAWMKLYAEKFGWTAEDSWLWGAGLSNNIHLMACVQVEIQRGMFTEGERLFIVRNADGVTVHTTVCGAMEQMLKEIGGNSNYEEIVENHIGDIVRDLKTMSRRKVDVGSD